MPNVANILKVEFSRLARKELRSETEVLKKTVSAQRSELVALKRRVQDLEKALKKLARNGSAASTGIEVDSEPDGSEAANGLRFSAKGLASNRRKLGLSAADYGMLVGASGQSIYCWETGRTRPRPRNVAAIAALRGASKAEVEKRLAALKQNS